MALCPRWLVHGIAALAVALAVSMPAKAADPPRRRILFISSYHPEFPSFFAQIHGLRSGLEAAGYRRQNLTLDVEFMDTKRFPRSKMDRPFRELLSYKLLNLPKYDVLVVGDDDAFGFALDNQDSLFRGMPIVFLGVNNVQKALAQNSNPHVVGVVEALSMRDTLRLIKRLFPANKAIHVVVDDTLTGAHNRKQIEVEARKHADTGVEYHRLGTMRYDELFAELGKLPPSEPILLDSFFRDRDGRVLDFYESLANVKAVFKGPIFAMQSHGLGYGILGGKMVSHEEQGRAAARLVALILSGTPVSSLRVIADSPNVYGFDYAEVVRLGIDPSLLPAGSIFVNRPQSIVDKYFTWMIAGAVFIVLQTAMIVLLLLNIRQRKRAEISLRRAMGRVEHANRAKSEFLSRMSHELRTPLNAIIGFSEIVKKELLGPIGVPRYRNYAEDIHTSGTHLLAIINDLLEMTKMSAGEVRLQERIVDALVPIENAMMQIEVNARQRGVKLSHPSAPPGLQLRVDPRRVTQILLNLLSNAVKFTPNGGTVGVRVEAGGDGAARIRVSDTGIGMSAEDLAEIVLPFRQVEDAFSTSHEGTGLGVPIAIELARLHGGTIEYESDIGKGTTATLVLPPNRVMAQNRESYVAKA